MKLVIASDLHGSAYWTRRLMDAIAREAPDRVVLLGDLLYHGPRNDLPRDYAPKQVIPLLNDLASTGCLTAVRGNCEAEVDQMVLSFPCMSDFSQLIDESGRTPLSYPTATCLAPGCTTAWTGAFAARGLRAGVRPHAYQGESGKRGASGAVAV